MFKKVIVISAIIVCSTSFGMFRIGSPILRTSSATGTDDKRIGGLYTITGPMACGKSDELMRIISILHHADCKYLVCKHCFDTRSSQFLISRRRTGDPIGATLISDPSEILVQIERNPVDYVAIDEVQFFKDNPMTSIIKTLIARRIYVIAAGLDKDFKGDPFGKYDADGRLTANPYCIDSLIAMADECVKLPAICEVCKQWNATMTQRLVNGKPASKTDPLVVVDDGTKKEITYEPRCRECHKLAD